MVVSLHIPPSEFDAASASIRETDFRADLVVNEIRAPSGLAPDALALSGDVRPRTHGTDSEFGTGRFILLHDSAEPEAWRGPFRVVCFAQAPLEHEIGADPFLPDVAWSWLMDALAAHNAAFDYPSGTATTINSRGYGELADQQEGAQIELRASWSPLDLRLGAHAEAWGELLCMLAGLPPVEGDAAADVQVLSHRRGQQ